MPGLERRERYAVIALTVTLLMASGAIAYKRSRAAEPLRIEKFTPQPEGHTREGVDEWPSGGIPLHGRDRDPALKDAMAVRPWSFTVRKTASVPSHGRININKADVKSLAALDGIGEVMAARIVEYRSSRGPFLLTDDIKKVRGIGPALYDRIKDDIVTE
jgi:competence ComEA-like helix-hairpin-helix protein